MPINSFADLRTRLAPWAALWPEMLLPVEEAVGA